MLLKQLIKQLDSYYYWGKRIETQFSKCVWVSTMQSHALSMELRMEIILGAPQDLDRETLSKFHDEPPLDRECWLLINFQASDEGVERDFKYEMKGKRTLRLETQEDFDKAFSVVYELERYLSKTKLLSRAYE